MNVYIRFTLHLSNRALLDIARKEFGALLKKSNLRYRTEKSFQSYPCTPNSIGGHWALDFLVLPPEFQQDNHLENLRCLKESSLKSFQAAHPELGDVTIYRNLGNFPHLLQTMSAWWQ